MKQPRIGITADVEPERLALRHGYVECVERAGGIPIVLPPTCTDPERLLEVCDGLILSGGDDPDMTAWNEPMHAEARAIDPRRQACECALLDLARAQEVPVLGICLGMQLMGLQAGGRLDQHLPDSLPTAADHWNRRVHAVAGAIGSGEVLSHHRQAITDPGSMSVVATAPDEVIEAIADPDRPCWIGVQWHPERTDDPALGAALFERLVATAAQTTAVRG